MLQQQNRTAIYLDFTELTKPMLNELIDKIVVHEGDKSTGKRTQKIDIYRPHPLRFSVSITHQKEREKAELSKIN